MLDFTKRHTFLGVDFKPYSKHGSVRKSQVLKMLQSGHAECYSYSYDDMTGTERTTMDPENLTGIMEEFNHSLRLCRHEVYGNPRYAHQTYITVRFHSNSFVHIYDVRELPELAEPTEEESEGCQACEECPEVEEPPEFGGLHLAVNNGPLGSKFHWRKAQ